MLKSLLSKIVMRFVINLLKDHFTIIKVKYKRYRCFNRHDFYIIGNNMS
jgi:hypothetical protein